MLPINSIKKSATLITIDEINMLKIDIDNAEKYAPKNTPFISEKILRQS